MTKFSYTLNIFIAAMTFLYLPISEAGKESGGGGGVIYRASGPILIDFLHIDPNFEDTREFSQWQANRGLETLLTTPLHLNHINELSWREKIQSLDYVLGILEVWEKQVFDLVGLSIHVSFHTPLIWQTTTAELHDPNFFWPSAVEKNAKTRFAAFYSKNDSRQFTVSINQNIWNQLGLFSQAGLLMHEALRHIQMGWSYSSNEKSLQRATAILILCKPRASLDYYVNFLVRNKPEIAEKIYGDFETFMKTDCERVH